jgi:hypothetical protein
MKGSNMKHFILLVTALAVIFVFTGMSSAAGELNGTYISKDNKNEYITFGHDGKFFLKQKKKSIGSETPSYDSIEGTFKIEGDSVTMKLPDGAEALGKIKDGTFFDNERKIWIKEGTPKKMEPVTQPKRRSSY